MKKQIKKKYKKNKFNIYSILYVVVLILFINVTYQQYSTANKEKKMIMKIDNENNIIKNEIEEFKVKVSNVDKEEFVKEEVKKRLKLIEKNEYIIKYK